MRTDAELEQLLRETLTGRAGDVHDALRWIAPPAPVRPPRRWLPALAAAAAVVLVAAGVIIGVRLTHSTKPAHPSPPPTINHAPICSTTVPESWNSAVKRGAIEPNGTNLQALAVAPNGTVLAVRGANPDIERFEVLIVTPDRRSSPVLLPLSQNMVADGRSATINNRWALFGTRNVAWTNAAVLWVIDLKHGPTARKILDLTAQGVTGGQTLQDWLLLGDSVYYTASDTYPSSHYRLYRYDLRTNTRTQVAAGRRLTMHSVYGSLSYRSRPTSTTWGPQVVLVPGDLPDGVPTAVTDGTHIVVTDGTSVAWSELDRTAGRTPTQTAYWWAPGGGAPVIALQKRVPRDAHFPPAFEVSAVAGPFVFLGQYDTSANHVLDVRTHVDAAWVTHDQYAAWFAWASGGGRVAVEYSSEKFGPNTTYLPDIASLPPLTCR